MALSFFDDFFDFRRCLLDDELAEVDDPDDDEEVELSEEGEEMVLGGDWDGVLCGDGDDLGTLGDERSLWGEYVWAVSLPLVLVTVSLPSLTSSKALSSSQGTVESSSSSCSSVGSNDTASSFSLGVSPLYSPSVSV